MAQVHRADCVCERCEKVRNRDADAAHYRRLRERLEMSVGDRTFWRLTQLAIILWAAAALLGAIADLLKIFGVK